jgi:hypothetical protein
MKTFGEYGYKLNSSEVTKKRTWFFDNSVTVGIINTW